MIIGQHSSSTIGSGKKLPVEWTENLTKTLTEAYFDQSEKDNRFFSVFGEIFEEEFVVIVSYIHHDDPLASPYSLFISHDIIDGDKDFRKVLDGIVDFSGHVFDDIFATKDWNEYIPTWTENKFRNINLFYKLTRENISLTMQAEEILKNNLPV